MSKSKHKEVWRPDKTLKNKNNKHLQEEPFRKTLKSVFQEEEDFDLWNTQKEDEEHEYWESFTEENNREPQSSGVSRTEESVSGDSEGEGAKSGTG